MVSLIHPLPGSTHTDPYGWRGAIPGVVGAQLHSGQDYAAAGGTRIRAGHAGTVTRVWHEWGMGGNMVEVTSPFGFATRYAHMASKSPRYVGQTVKAGDTVGYVGATGAATGNHLHFELLIGGRFVNPVPYIGADPKPNKPIPKPKPKGKPKMADRATGFIYKGAGGTPVYLIIEGPGIYHEYSMGGGKSMPGAYNNAVARAYDTGSYESISRAHASVIKRSHDRYLAALAGK